MKPSFPPLETGNGRPASQAPKYNLRLPIELFFANNFNFRFWKVGGAMLMQESTHPKLNSKASIDDYPFVREKRMPICWEAFSSFSLQIQLAYLLSSQVCPTTTFIRYNEI